MSTATKRSLPVTRDVVNHVFNEVKEYSKNTGQIPTDDYDYHLAFPGFRRHIRSHSTALIDLMDKCCQLLPKRRRIHLEPVDAETPQLSEAQRTAVMETIDSLLENVDSVLDDLRGRKMHSDDQLSLTFGSVLGGGTDLATSADSANGFMQIAHVMRPQLTFEAPVDNSTEPFVPVYYDVNGIQHTATEGVHPFANEINTFNPPAEQLMPRPEIPYPPLETCPLRFIDSKETLKAMVQEISQTTEIAIDLEHHDFYTYQGFTCLMQISTRSSDYIVDCLRLRSSMHLLAPVFLNSSILKVLHGAREDIRWLQKDFALYLVNFFDTGIALQTLHMPYSLAFAVDHFCQVKLNKKYQTADWRVRPLPAEMVEYARQDTHYLLYIHDRLRALLLNSENRSAVGNLLVHVYKESRQLSLRLYEKPVLNPSETYKIALGRSLGGLSTSQERVAREIFNWRDCMAREVDDCPTAVLHLSSVLAIASKLPMTAKDLLRCCSPVSATVRAHVSHLVDIVKATVVTERSVAAGEPAHGTGGNSASLKVAFFAGQRRLGEYRPMTGALPSVSTVIAPAYPTVATVTENGKAPSEWFIAMQHLSKRIAARPMPQVPLPGNEISAMIHSLALKNAASVAAHAGQLENREEDIQVPPVDPDNLDDEMKGETVAVKTPADLEEVEPARVPAEEGAVSLRQVYGTGPSNRRRAAKKSSPQRRK